MRLIKPISKLSTIILAQVAFGSSPNLESETTPISFEEEVQILEETLDPRDFPKSPLRLNEIVRKFDADSLIEIRDAIGKDIRLINLNMWHYLISIGANKETLQNIDRYDLSRLVQGFMENMWPREWIEDIGTASDLILYSREFAETSPNYGEDLEITRERIKTSLFSRSHIERTATDYSEDPSQIDRIENEHILHLLDRYIAYFESDSAKKDIPPLFEEEVENGGLLFFDDEGSLTFHQIPNHAREYGGDPKESYLNPRIQEYIPNLGLLHTHPLGDFENVNSISGPSGYSKRYPGAQNYRADTGLLRKIQYGNPYFMDVVVSEALNGTHNVDAYFSDVQIIDGRVVPDKKITVIDLGVFDYN